MDDRLGAEALIGGVSPEGMCGSLLTAGVLVGLLATALYFGYLELSKFTGGKLLRLEEVDERLAKRLDRWLPLPERWSVASRVSPLLLWGVSAALFGLSFAGLEREGMRWLAGLVLLVSALSLLTLANVVAPRLSLRSTASLLCVYIPLFRLVSWVLLPFAWLSALSSREVAAKAATEGGEEENVATAEDEILSLISRSDGDEDGGSGLEEDERRMISGALRLDEKKVHEIMTPRVDIDSIDVSESIDEVKRVIVNSGHSRIPVCSESIDKIVGVIFAKDLLNAEKVSQAQEQGLSVLCREPMLVSEYMNIGDLLEQFQTKKSHFAVVIDEYGGTSGIVTFEDILEELVGEIWDEYDKPADMEPEPQPDQDGWTLFSARTSIGKVNATLGVEIPEDEDYDTLGGYLTKVAGHIPLQDETLEDGQLRAVIVSADPQCVKSVRLMRLPDDAETDTSSEPHEAADAAAAP